jgi:hypothetical protein
MTDTDEAFRDLENLVSHGSRFHGTSEIEAAAGWLEEQLVHAGHVVHRQTVSLPGWHPGTVAELSVAAPISRRIPAWPMLGSGTSKGARKGRVVPVGPQGLWGDSMVWQKFAVEELNGQLIGYLHARDNGPAAPQPLPSGSDKDVAHLAIGHLDGLQLTEWISDDFEVQVELNVDSGYIATASADNLIVDIGSDIDTPHVVVCAHYDTFFNTRGAYDNGSGTIALLRLARSWAVVPPSRPVRIVFFTAEEWHLGGSRFYVEQLSAEQRKAVSFLINIDGLGRGSSLEAFAGPEAFERQFLTSITAYIDETRPEVRVVSRFPATKGTDDASFQAVGIPTGFITFNDLHRLHQPEDEPNLGIATNIAWTVPLVRRLVEGLESPALRTAPGLL